MKIMRANLKELKKYCDIDANITGELFYKLCAVYQEAYQDDFKILTREVEFYNDTMTLNQNRLVLDRPLLHQYQGFVMEKRKLAKEKFDSLYQFSPTSPKQTLDWLNASGNYRFVSVDKKVLTYAKPYMTETQKQMLSLREDLVSNIYKKLDRVELYAYQDRLAPNFIHFGTVTGRYTSRGANLLNFPHSKKELALGDSTKLKDLKGQFRRLIKTGRTMLHIDYKQIELRILLYLTKHQEALEFLYKGGDIYTNFGKLIFEKQEIDKNQRFMAKECVLSLGYGASLNRLMVEMGSVDYLPALRKGEMLYHKHFNRVKPMWTILADEIKRTNGCLTLPNGVKRFLDFERISRWPIIALKRAGFKPEAQAKVNGKSVGGLKSKEAMGSHLASIKCQSIVREIMAEKKSALLKAGYKVLFDVHDEIVFDEPEENTEAIVKIMEAPIDWLPDFIFQTDVDKVFFSYMLNIGYKQTTKGGYMLVKHLIKELKDLDQNNQVFLVNREGDPVELQGQDISVELVLSELTETTDGTRWSHKFSKKGNTAVVMDFTEE